MKSNVKALIYNKVHRQKNEKVAQKYLDKGDTKIFSHRMTWILVTSLAVCDKKIVFAFEEYKNVKSYKCTRVNSKVNELKYKSCGL